MKILSIRHWILILTVMVAMCLGPANVFAEETSDLPDLTGDKGSLKVYLAYHDEDKEVAVAGGKFAVYKVSGIKVKDGVPAFNLTEQFRETGIDISGMNASESAEAAKAFAKVVNDKKLSATEQITDASGETTFSNLDYGVYLVMQTDATGDAVKFERISPYIVTVPLYDSASNSWLYDVRSAPKETLNAPPENTTPPPETTTVTGGGGTSGGKSQNNKTPGEGGGTSKHIPKIFKTLIDTGDTTTIMLYAGLLIAAVAILVFLFARRKKERE